ncbi:hypothetical protein [Vibrio campbellii]|uniref:hypothetical protein n=1 Tax=Vibrio campbellii TaxID=680 RepID=UPI000CD36401|nr:hypothetical protein [Vibrio campbellii]AUW04805.1 hypothetical protein C1N51_14505 [Vibrio campbellii]
MANIIYLNSGRDSVRVSDYSKKVLRDIMASVGLKKIMITSTARTANDQARIMLGNIEKYGVEHQKKLYGRYGDQIIDFYSTLKSSGKSRPEILNRMASKVNEIGPRKVSRHAGDYSKLNVIDIGPSIIPIPLRENFENAVRADSRVAKFLVPPKDPAYHLEIPQYSVGQSND